MVIFFAIPSGIGLDGNFVSFFDNMLSLSLSVHLSLSLSISFYKDLNDLARKLLLTRANFLNNFLNNF